jgi:hypothetical protein
MPKRLKWSWKKVIGAKAKAETIARTATYF